MNQIFILSRVVTAEKDLGQHALCFIRAAFKEKEYKASNSRLIASNSSNAVEPEKKERLTKDEILRYSRQLILPEIGVKGQIKLCNASVLVVGAGGLGCPVAQYLAAAGVGHIGTVDYDTVEISNLHRQVLHTESRVNISKAESIKIQIHQYLLNDACILAGKPLVSGSALRFEGQLTVYNHDGGPCYRCLFPKPPPPESVGNCSDNGVLGPASYSQKMLIYDALDGRFLTIKLRPRQSNCAVCGDNPSIRKLMDYELFCGASATDKTPSLEILQEQQRISVHEYKRLIDECSPHILLDVREPVELEICSLPVETLIYVLCKQGNDSQKAVKLLRETVLHRNTNKVLRSEDDFLQSENKQDVPETSTQVDVVFKDIAGGLYAWAKHIDDYFPVY
ncbi:Adenylyltransferase and sulfurtransferase MOCS3 [Stylophora pistillata]|uniref:Adenylyltransferase and sulfurtransferase MOCS3 n=1 Tax=Stylophora pistillata TaxID=50429 RepID=A0A2B4RUN4_STYPI|nr:Adenylyltransferase and sulfurtransferase MOCS3 [Stylophora pistillata]